jgi:hypothetical protein
VLLVGSANGHKVMHERALHEEDRTTRWRASVVVDARRNLCCPVSEGMPVIVHNEDHGEGGIDTAPS